MPPAVLGWGKRGQEAEGPKLVKSFPCPVCGTWNPASCLQNLQEVLSERKLLTGEYVTGIKTGNWYSSCTWHGGIIGRVVVLLFSLD